VIIENLKGKKQSQNEKNEDTQLFMWLFQLRNEK